MRCLEAVAARLGPDVSSVLVEGWGHGAHRPAAQPLLDALARGGQKAQAALEAACGHQAAAADALHLFKELARLFLKPKGQRTSKEVFF